MGTIITDCGTIEFRSFVHAERALIVTELMPSFGESCELKFVMLESKSPRQAYGDKYGQSSRKQPGYQSNPAGFVHEEKGIEAAWQPLSVGGGTATAWKSVDVSGRKLHYASLQHSHPDDRAYSIAVEQVSGLSDASLDELEKSHRRWWHAYYPLSFVSLPDTRLEGFYWIQIYKIACISRPDSGVMDNQGPWLQESPWPGTWWNLNVQLDYWIFNTSNRMEIGKSLRNTLQKYMDHLIANSPPEYQYDSAYVGLSTGLDCLMSFDEMSLHLPHFHPLLGNLPWICHNLWLEYRYSMDREFLKELVYPLLRRSINMYMHFLEEGEDGKLHLPETSSPEYGKAPDCNFDLSLLRWGCETLVQITGLLGIVDPLHMKWKDVLTRLTEFPASENEGYHIGRGVPYAFSHRHHSHLIMVYPLHLVDPAVPEHRERIETSLSHWQSKTEALRGYSYTLASAISSTLGKGNDALNYLDGLWSAWLRPNTMYYEDGPCIETPLTAAVAVHDMLLQSWGGIVRVFPAVPDSWEDAVFHLFRAEGAFLISAKREAGRTVWIRIHSLEGEPLKLDHGGMKQMVMVPDHRVRTSNQTGNVIELHLVRGEEVVLYEEDSTSTRLIEPLKADARCLNYYGLPSKDSDGKGHSYEH